jgi:uncharacterized protein (TIGR03437 family)
MMLRISGLFILAALAAAQDPAVIAVHAGKYPLTGAAHAALSSLGETDASGGLAHASTPSVSVTQISNAATFALAPLPNSGIAQGSFFAIFGSGLGPLAANCGAGLSNCIWSPYPLPTVLPATGPGTSVNVTVGGVSAAAYLYFAVDSQINAIMPSTVPPGTGTLTVTFNGVAGQPIPITVVASAFGTFSGNEAGTGPGDFFNIGSNGGLSGGPADCQGCNSLLNPATPGQFITLFGNGLGAPVDVATEGTVAPVFPDDFTKPPHNLDIQVFVGNQPATISYAGRSQYSGEDQINFLIPQGVDGCYVPVAIFAGPQGGQIVSNFTTISVSATGAPCSDTSVFNASGIASILQNNGSANIGLFDLTSDFVTDPATSAQAVSDQVNGVSANLTARALELSSGFGTAPSAGGCIVLPYTGIASEGADPVLNSASGLVTGLGAGTPFDIAGPNGTQPVPETSVGIYGATVGGVSLSDPSGSSLPPFFLNSQFDFLAGNYTLAGPGGANVGSFSQIIDIPSPIVWTNQTALAANPIPRWQSLNITWSGGTPGTFVVIAGAGSSTTNSNGPQTTDPGAHFTCVAPVAAGQFSVPSFVLQALPETNGSPWSGYLVVGSEGPSLQMSPTPAGLDAAYLFYRVVSGTNVSWQ